MADVRRPIIAEPLVQRGFRVNKEASEGTSISRVGASVQCRAKDGLDFLRARLVPSEFRTVGEMNIDKALISAGMRHTPVRRSSCDSSACIASPRRQTTTHTDPFAVSPLVFGLC